MQVEVAEQIQKSAMTAAATAVQNSESSSNEDVAATTATNVDPFYGAARQQFRSAARRGSEVTYLEEKCLFWVDKLSGKQQQANGGFVGRSHPSHPTWTSTASRQSDAASSSSSSGPKKFLVPIHQHLLDQHRQREYFVNDSNGRMVTPTVSLSADFFHPMTRSSGRAQKNTTPTTNRSNKGSTGPAGNDEEQPDVVQLYGGGEWRRGENGDEQEDEENITVTIGWATSSVEIAAPLPSPVLKTLLNSVELAVYHSATSVVCSRHSASDGPAVEVRKHLRSRFATYHRRLESFLAKGDPAAFDECMLDFWDEFFPHTAGIHYYDLETAVPRISSLRKFLTKPLPVALGTVQCEIERIKIGSKGKGVNVKGRLFPTYEYRLFIRNRPAQETAAVENEESGAPTACRRDTVLIVAKNRGRKHAEATGVVPISAAAKKGSNNYYLYMPQQMDVDDHYNRVNENADQPGRLIPNGASYHPVLVSDDAGSTLLGRLQSNFIGTEFQIFTPQLQKTPRRRTGGMPSSLSVHSEDGSDYDSGMSSDNLRRSRFGRLSLRRHGNISGDILAAGSCNEPCRVSDQPRSTLHRTHSSPEISHQRLGRSNRRAIANNDAQQQQQQQQQQTSQSLSIWREEEDGAITYTANILGNRPRVMDVCIPKVSADGMAAAEWKRHLASCDDTDDCQMLSCFRQLLLNSLDDPPAAVPPAAAANGERGDNAPEAGADAAAATDTDFGLMALQNRQPWWNDELGSFVLNFGGRVSVASVKNFQLCERTNSDRIMLQFGRITGRHSFTMDYQHPLTAVQAFSIAISSLQSKISFG
jgi:Tub family